ncbi:MAG: HAD hydrolase-like protein [Elusimicrobia bacterium]|nr:HAD hydrolase-like protein [Elusimicrobiota bacterium]
MPAAVLFDLDGVLVDTYDVWESLVHDVARSKPAPDMVLEACRRLRVRPADALMVGDSDFDERAALSAGVRFIRFRSFADLRRLPGVDP